MVWSEGEQSRYLINRHCNGGEAVTVGKTNINWSWKKSNRRSSWSCLERKKTEIRSKWRGIYTIGRPWSSMAELSMGQPSCAINGISSDGMLHNGGYCSSFKVWQRAMELEV